MNGATRQDKRQPSPVEDALLADALLGGGLPPEAEWHLWEAGLSYHLDDVSEQHLRKAEALAPGHAAVLVGLYRFYFYKGRLGEALDVARQCLEKAARENNLADWRDVKAGDAWPLRGDGAAILFIYSQRLRLSSYAPR
jgi:hypothetical protein